MVFPFWRATIFLRSGSVRYNYTAMTTRYLIIAFFVFVSGFGAGCRKDDKESVAPQEKATAITAASLVGATYRYDFPACPPANVESVCYDEVAFSEDNKVTYFIGGGDIGYSGTYEINGSKIKVYDLQRTVILEFTIRNQTELFLTRALYSLLSLNKQWVKV